LLADDTSLAYFANTPRGVTGGGARQAARRRAISSSATLMQQRCGASCVTRIHPLDQGDGPTHCSFWRNMPDHHAVSATGKPTIRNQADRITQSFADDRSSGR